MSNIKRSKFERPVVIGLVGGIASGKSYVSGLLESLGALRIDADRIGHEVLRRADVRAQLTQLWGPEVLTDGEIDRAKIGRLVFGDSKKAVSHRRQLEALLHPLIRGIAMSRIAAAKALPHPPLAIVIDAPLLLEAGWDSLCQLILFIDAPLAERIQRSRARGWADEHFADREKSQMSLTEKRSRATHLLDNSQPANMAAQVERVWRELEKSVES